MYNFYLLVQYKAECYIRMFCQIIFMICRQLEWVLKEPDNSLSHQDHVWHSSAPNRLWNAMPKQSAISTKTT